jgi:uncharacterized protein YciI
MIRLILVLLCVANGYTFAQSYTFVFLNKREDKKELPKEELDELMKGHFANMDRLVEEGKLIVAGPFDGGGGIFIFKSRSVDETKEWISTDPAVKAEQWNIEVLPYAPRQGGVCLAEEPYEMVTYTFIRFTPQITKFTAPTYPQIFKRHDEYLVTLKETGNVITEGTFGDTDGGILIMKGELESAVLERDPSVQEMLMEFEAKKLWVAKGSFCEK